MREYVTAVRALVAGEELTRDGPVFTLNRVSLDIGPPPQRTSTLAPSARGWSGLSAR